MQVISDAIVTLASLMVVAAYIWSVRGHFSSPRTPARAWLISAAVTISTLLLTALVWLNDAPLLATLTGLVLEVGSALLFAATVRTSRQARLRFAFDPEHPASLLSTGPYRYVRHPFYVSYIIFWTGWSIAAWSLIVVIIPPVFLYLYWQAARMEERNFAASPLAQNYESYRAQVGFFFPRLSRN